MDEYLDQESAKASMGSTELPENFAHRMFETALIVDKYYTPLLFLFGTLGNSLSLLVFCMNAKYRSQSASYYLSALAISDTGFLVNLLAVWLETVHGGVITSGLMCPLVMYLGQVTCFMSVYLTVAFSIERYVAVHYPLSRPRICTRSKARKAIAALTVIALLVFSYAWVIARVIEPPLKSDQYGEQYQDIFTTTNFTEDSPEGALPFPGESREKDFIFSSHPASAQFLTSNDLGTRNKDAFQQGENCGNGNYLMPNNSLNLRQQIESLNCSRMHLNEMTSRDSRHFSLSGESREESSFSVENVLEVEKNLTADEQNFMSGGYICTVPEGYYRISEIANYLDSVVTLIIPFFLITFFNVRIATCVWKLKDQRQSIVASSTANINHHHSLRCSNKSSIHHLKNSKTPKSSTSTRQNHLSQQPQYSGAPLRENGNINAETDFENPTMYSKLQKGAGRRFKETCNRFTATGQSHNTTSSSSGSEENSQTDNFGHDNNASSTSHHFQNSGGNQGLNASARRLSTSDTLKASSKFLRKTSALGRFGAGERINWEQRQTPLSTRVTIKPEFSVVRERISSHHPSSSAAEVRVTKTLLLVSTVFLVLNLPAHAIRCAHFIQSLRGTTEGRFSEFLHAAQAWTNILFNTNFAVNFLLYCVSGRNFRKSLKNIILRKFSRSPTSVWKSGKTRNKDRASYSARVPASKRNCLKELQVTEIVEMEERVEDSVFPMSNCNTEDVHGDGKGDEESMQV